MLLLKAYRIRQLISHGGAHSRSFYDIRTKDDTIFAPSTSIQAPRGSPMAMVRVSGPKTGLILSQLTKRTVLDCFDREDLSSRKVIKPRYATLTKIFKPKSNEIIDTGIALWFPGPDSYTGQNVCEFHIHGSQAIMSALLTSLSSFDGLRPAEAGEFTRRAVMNKKLSLYQAECLPDLIASKTEQQRKFALKGYDLTTKSRFDQWILDITTILAHFEASIDFGEDYIIEEQEMIAKCKNNLRNLCQDLDRFIRESSRCRDIIQSGLKAVILGRPNSGKSSLMNLLCRRQKSIVSNLSGTTRDIIEHNIDVGGNSVILCDTAGLRNLSDTSTSEFSTSEISLNDNILEMHSTIELEGIKNALNASKNADVIIYMLDGTRFLIDDKAEHLISEIEEVKTRILDENVGQPILLLLINKVDLVQKDIDRSWLKSVIENKIGKDIDIGLDFISCNTMENYEKFLERLALKIHQYTVSGNNSPGTLIEGDIPKMHFVNERHLSLLNSSLRHLRRSLELENQDSMDRQAQHVREALDYLSRIVGTVENDEVIDVIFRDFCIGK